MTTKENLCLSIIMPNYKITGKTEYAIYVKAGDKELAEEKWFEQVGANLLEWKFEFEEIKEN